MSKTIIVGMVGGALAVAGTGGGAAYYIQHYSKPSEAEIHAAAAEAARERYVRDEEINYVTLISTINPRRGSTDGSTPIMVTLHLAGARGLGEFCAERPVVEEALLRALEQDGMHAAVREAVNRVLGDAPVRGFNMRPMTDAAVGGKAEYETAKKCRLSAAAAKSSHAVE